MHHVARVFLFSILVSTALSAAFPLKTWAQSLPESEESASSLPLSSEASAYLIDTKIGDANVDLVWDGYWRMSLITGGRFGKQTEESRFPGLAQGTAFIQEPDLTLTLWLNKRWFIETTFLEGYERNTYRAGYIGGEDEFVQSVVVGNAGVSATSYAEIDVPTPKFNTPGISAHFATKSSDHEILLRYDPTEGASKTFRGQYEVKSSDIGLADYIQGQFFILPDTGVTNVQVYLEDRLGNLVGTDAGVPGTNRRYRLAEPVEFFVDGETGFVELAEPHEGRVLIYYDEPGGAPVGTTTVPDFVVASDANLRPDFGPPITYEPFSFNGDLDPYDPAGRDFSETSRVTIAGKDALILYDPGRFTPFERQNIYRSPDALPQESWRVTPLLQDRGALYPKSDPGYDWVANPEQRTITAYGHEKTTIETSVESLRHPANRYPFALANPEVYGPGRETDPDKVSRIIVLAIRENNPGYFLGTGVVPGSVVVRVNGVRDKTVQISDTGSIIFKRFIFPEDWIEVDYRTESISLDGGDLFIYQGNRFQLRPNLTLELAESLRWNLNQSRTVENVDDSPGEIQIASSLDWESDRASLRLTGAGSLSTPNTAGNLRLFGMEKGGLGLVYLDSTLHPAPADVGIGTTRIETDKYDYISYDAFGRQILNDYLWSGASDTGTDGPSLAGARSGDPSEGRVMELRFNTSAAGEWVAGDALADPNGPINLSSYTEMEISIKFLDVGGAEPDVYLQMGEIGESADHHNDGSENGANPALSVEWNLDTDTDTLGGIGDAWNAPGTWQTLHISFSPTDRAKLSSVRSFRLIIDNQPGGPLSGRAILGTPRFGGSSFRAEIRSPAIPAPGNLLVAAQDVAADEVVAGDLKNAYSEVSDLFHPDGETNEALRIRWGSDAGGAPLGTVTTTDDRWEAVSWFDGVPLESYRKLVFYVKSDQPSPGDPLNVRATDEDNRGITVSWEPNSPLWDRITVDIAEGTAVSARGAPINFVSVDNDTGSITRFLLSGTDQDNNAGTAARSGTVYLDEIHFSDPAMYLSGGTELQAEWHYEEDVAAVGDFPILGNITLGSRTSIVGGRILSGLDRNTFGFNGMFNASADIIGVGLSTDWQVSTQDGRGGWAGSHALRIPARSSVFWFGDAYERSENEGTDTFSRRNELSLRFAPGGVNNYTETIYDGLTVLQSWGGDTFWSGPLWETNLKIDYILNTESQPESEGSYFSTWINGYIYLLPADGEISSREINHQLGTEIIWGPATFKWVPELKIKTARSPVWNQENIWAGTLSVPLKFERGWTLTPSYRRRLRQKIDISDMRGDGGYGEMWNVLADEMNGQFPLFTYLPFRELFGTQDGENFAGLTQGMSEADYETEFSVDMSRRSGSKIMDLVVPSTATVSIERDYQRKGDTVGWENLWFSSLGFNALNLFGRFGRYPLFNFYNSEDISGLLQIILKDYNGAPAPAPEELTWQTNLSFQGNRQRRFMLDHRISWHWNSESRDTRQEAAIEYQWRTASKDALRLPLVKRAIPRQHHMESRERLIVKGLYPWGDAPPDTEFNLAFTFYHESKWLFRDTGHLKAWAALGLGNRDGILINGFELGLEAEFRF